MGMAGSRKGHSVNFKSKHYKRKESSEEFKVKEKAAHFSLYALLLSFILFTLEGETNDIDLGAPIPPVVYTAVAGGPCGPLRPAACSVNVPEPAAD